MITIESDGLDVLLLDDWESGLVCESFDLGFPNVRAVVNDRPGAHGTIDETRYFGSRSVALKLNAYAGTLGSRRAILDRVAPFCDPGRRSTIRFEDPTGGGPRAIDVRAGDASAPLVNDTLTQMAVSWVAPSGVIYSDTTHQITTYPASGGAPGVSFNVTFPLPFPAFVAGSSAVPSDGTLAAHWTAALYGPFTGPQLINRTSGEMLSFPGLTIGAGDFLYLDSLERTVTINNIESATRYAFMDFAASTWWTLAPGMSQIEFAASSSAPPACAVFAWRDTYLI